MVMHLNVFCPSMIDQVVNKFYATDVNTINDNKNIHWLSQIWKQLL